MGIYLAKFGVGFYGQIYDLSCYVKDRHLEQMRHYALLQERPCGVGDFICD